MIPISYPSPRVSQLDAYILDSELITLLKQQLASIFQLHTTSWWTYSQNIEFWNLLLNLLVFRLTAWKTGSSYGLSLQNLKLTDFKKGSVIGYSKRTLLMAVLFGDYLYNKLMSYLYSIDESNSSQNKTANFSLIERIKTFFVINKTTVLSKLNDLVKLLNIINFTVFLVNGRYPSVIHRILGVSLTPIVTDLLKFNGDSVNFEFQNRQLVWNVMTEFLVFILPLLQLRKIKRMAQKVLFPYKKNSKENSVFAGEVPVNTPYTNLPISQCAICHNNIATSSINQKNVFSSCTVTNPYITNCGHIYCYICIATKFNAIENSDVGAEGCLRCGLKLKWFREYGEDEGEIDEDAIIITYEDIKEDHIEPANNEDVLCSDLENGYEEEIREFEKITDNESLDGQDEESSEYSEEEEYEADESFDL